MGFLAELSHARIWDARLDILDLENYGRNYFTLQTGKLLRELSHVRVWETMPHIITRSSQSNSASMSTIMGR